MCSGNADVAVTSIRHSVLCAGPAGHPTTCDACKRPRLAPHLLVLKLEPVDAVGAAVRVVMPAVGAAAVHQHAVQAVLVAFAAVRVRGQVLAVADVQVQLLVELVPVVDLRSGSWLMRFCITSSHEASYVWVDTCGICRPPRNPDGKHTFRRQRC